jgi:16S rRNA (guanine527-N7)-methyltransferase
VGDVSRETTPPADVLDTWFGSAASGAGAFADLLTGEGVRRGLLGPREAGRVWSRHLLNCVVVHPLIGDGATVADVGSGAGLPGVVLALARPDLHVTLVEPLLRRVTFLREVAETLRLPNLDVRRARAEELAGRCQFDVVTARAVAPLDRLVGWLLPLCRPGGEVLALKGSNVADEIASARPALSRLHAGRVEVHACGLGVVDPETTVVRIQSNGPLVT